MNTKIMSLKNMASQSSKITSLFLMLLFASLFGCSTSGNQNYEQSRPVNGSGNSATTVPENETLREKPLPLLGSITTQLQFEADDTLAILEGKPRPTYPKELAVLAGNPPLGTDVCNLPYSALIKAMYDSCFPEGISYVAMSNIIGWAAEEISRSGDTVVYIWGDGKRGRLTGTFTNGRLTAKSQRGLK